MKRDPEFFKQQEDFIRFTYSNFGNSLQVYEKDFTGDLDAYCYKYHSNGITIYKVVVAKTGIESLDTRLLAHEFGHIGLGHLDETHEILDKSIYSAIQNNRDELIQALNKDLGIDYADKLLNRVLDDPQLNHSLHNIAMDFEVNTKKLSPDDIKEMEDLFTDQIIKQSPGYKSYEKFQSDLSDLLSRDTSKLTDEEQEILEKIKDSVKDQLSNMKVKLMLPERYHFKDGSPFPDNLTYPEYLILIVKNLDQFVKMMASLSNGGSGDTMEVSQEELEEALKNGMASIDDLMNKSGMSKGNSSGSGSNGQQNGSSNSAGYKGERPDSEEKDGDPNFGDHGTESRKDADNKRGDSDAFKGGGFGCSSKSGDTQQLDNVAELDCIDTAIEEVIRNFKKKVVGYELKRDPLYLYNRGINRTVLAPTYKNKVRQTTKPKVVYLIDVSGSMNSNLIGRIIKSISKEMSSIRGGLKYDIITWNTDLVDHFKDIDPNKPAPKLYSGGGTRMARGIEFFKKNYKTDSILVLISDFEDYLDEWARVTDDMSSYDLYAFNYGYGHCGTEFKNIKVREFNA